MALFKGKAIATYEQRIAHIRSTIQKVDHEKLIKHQPEVQYVNLIILQLRQQADLAEAALARRKTLRGKIKRTIGCRDVLDCHLNGMATRINDVYHHLNAGMEERKKDGRKQRERIPTKTEGRSVYKSNAISEDAGQEDDETDRNFEDAVEEQGEGQPQ